jgi:hypothetical protein
MPDDSNYLLQVIRGELQRQGDALVRRLELNGDSLIAYNGQLGLTAEVRSDPGHHPSIAHCHVTAVIGRTSFRGPLDACVMGIHADRRQGVALAAKNWVTNVGGTLFSLLHAKPVMNAAHFDRGGSTGVPGCHGFVGPLSGLNVRALKNPELILNAELFDCAAAMAPPGIVHLAKVVLAGQEDQNVDANA